MKDTAIRHVIFMVALLFVVSVAALPVSPRVGTAPNGQGSTDSERPGTNETIFPVIHPSSTEANFSWIRQFGTRDPDDAFASVADSIGAFVVGGTAGTLSGQRNAGGSDAFIRRYSSDGSEVWTRQFGTPGYDRAEGVAVDAMGVYVAGFVSGNLTTMPSQGGPDAFLRRYAFDGSEVCSVQFGTPGEDVVHDVAADATGVYVVGDWYNNNSALSTAFVRKYTPGCAEVWNRTFGSPVWDSLRGVAADSSGLFVAGVTAGALSGQNSSGNADAFVREYTMDGTEVWTRHFGTSNADVAMDLGVDSTGVYVSGQTRGAFAGWTNEGAFDAFVRKYALDGDEIWTRQFGTPDDDSATTIATRAGDVYVAGGSNHGDAFVRKYDTEGNKVWELLFGTPQLDGVSSITAGDSGVYIAGTTGGTLPGQTNAGSYDAFLAKLSGSTVTGRNVQVRVEPRTLNLKSQGQWVNGRITVQNATAFDVALGSITLNGVSAARAEILNNTTIAVKFDRTAFQASVRVGDQVEVILIGTWLDGQPFQAEDHIRVIDPGHGKP